MTLITLKINKPAHDSFVFIRESILDQAIKSGAKLEVVIPQGKAVIDPLEWKARGNVMSKVFKYKDNPMRLFGGSLLRENQQRLL